jgi:hypothetical protein
MAHDPFSDLRWIWRLVLQMGRTALWMAGTVWLGAETIWRGARSMRRIRWMFRETLPCPRGHETPIYGVFECACGALHEGWVFGRCRVCGLSAGWTPCVVCGLPVRNPRF